MPGKKYRKVLISHIKSLKQITYIIQILIFNQKQCLHSTDLIILSWFYGTIQGQTMPGKQKGQMIY